MIGRELIQRIREEDRSARILALVRTATRERSRRPCATPSALEDGIVEEVAGDLTRSSLGLARADLEQIAATVTHVLHAGASVRFDLPLVEARRVNVLGTGRLLDLAGRMRRLEHVVHVSTAYVAGEIQRPLLEGRASAGRLRNSYERSELKPRQSLPTR